MLIWLSTSLQPNGTSHIVSKPMPMEQCQAFKQGFEREPAKFNALITRIECVTIKDN